MYRTKSCSAHAGWLAACIVAYAHFAQAQYDEPLIPPTGMVYTSGVLVDAEEGTVSIADTPYTGPTEPAGSSDEPTSPPPSPPPDAGGSDTGGSVCAGEVLPCGDLTNYCDWQAGCSSSTDDGVDVCSGTAKDCADITNKDECTNQVGCDWQPAPPHSPRRGSSAVMPVVSWGMLVLVSAQMMVYILV